MEQRCQEIVNYLSGGKYPDGYKKTQKLSLRRYAGKFILKDGKLYYGSRRVIQSRSEAKSLFTELHSSSLGAHTGVVKTREEICSRFYWHGMSVDIEKWVMECSGCQMNGKSLAATQPLQSIEVSAVWELVGIDLLGPLPKTEGGFQYILTAADYFSKWVEAFPLKTKTASEVARQICSVVYRHGCPQKFLSDQGEEFVNEVNNNLCALLGIERSVTLVYHIQINGLDKRTNDNIKRALTKLANDCLDNWDVCLDPVLFALRSKIHTSTKHTPFLLMYGREAVFPAEVPIDMPLSTTFLPEESTYNSYLEKPKISKETVKNTIENISKSQEKRVLKEDKDQVYSDGQETLYVTSVSLDIEGSLG